jgi:hypothetical protein
MIQEGNKVRSADNMHRVVRSALRKYSDAQQNWLVQVDSAANAYHMSSSPLLSESD